MSRNTPSVKNATEKDTIKPCNCGNPAKVSVGDEPLCWTCIRRERGMPEWLIKQLKPIDEKL